MPLRPSSPGRHRNDRDSEGSRRKARDEEDVLRRRAKIDGTESSRRDARDLAGQTPRRRTKDEDARTSRHSTREVKADSSQRNGPETSTKGPDPSLPSAEAAPAQLPPLPSPAHGAEAESLGAGRNRVSERSGRREAGRLRRADDAGREQPRGDGGDDLGWGEFVVRRPEDASEVGREPSGEKRRKEGGPRAVVEEESRTKRRRSDEDVERGRDRGSREHMPPEPAAPVRRERQPIVWQPEERRDVREDAGAADAPAATEREGAPSGRSRHEEPSRGAERAEQDPTMHKAAPAPEPREVNPRPHSSRER